MPDFISVTVTPYQSVSVSIGSPPVSAALAQIQVIQADDMFNQFVRLGEDIDIEETPKAVYLSNGLIYKASADDINKCHVYGILLESGLQGQTRMVKIGGVVNSINWNWSDNSNSKIYLGINGNITQSVPSSGALIELGYPVSSSSMLLDIEETIML